MLLEDPALDHEYLPITGLPAFTSAAAKLILGADSPAIVTDRVTSAQTISGTGANHLGALFLSRFYEFNGDKKVYLSDPTWGAWLALMYLRFALTSSRSQSLCHLPQRRHRATYLSILRS